MHSGIGINVGPNASPTLLNNVVANLDVGIQVDPTSSTTVVGTTAYQENGTNTVGVNNVTNNTFPMYLQPTDPLFVDAAAGDFYPAEGSRIIDSSLDSLPDRANMITVRAAAGDSRRRRSWRRTGTCSASCAATTRAFRRRRARA